MIHAGGPRFLEALQPYYVSTRKGLPAASPWQVQSRAAAAFSGNGVSGAEISHGPNAQSGWRHLHRLSGKEAR